MFASGGEGEEHGRALRRFVAARAEEVLSGQNIGSRDKIFCVFIFKIKQSILNLLLIYL